MGKRSPFRVFLAVILIVVCMFLSACGGGTTFGSATQTPVPTCVPPGSPNLYRDHKVDEVVNFYGLYVSNMTANPGALENLRKEAFLRLVENIRYESATRFLSDDQSRSVQATVTLLDPVLIQYVILNQMLYNITSYNLPISAEDPYYGVAAFEARVLSAMQDIAAREELLFLVTVTFPSTGAQTFGSDEFTIEIPFENMQLVNASDVHIPSTHDDHNIGAPMQIGDDIVSGLIGFPFGLGLPNQCNNLLDAWNTTLTLEVSGIRLGTAQPLGIRMWTVPFNPLIQDDFIHHGDPFHHSAEYNGIGLHQLTSTSTPPAPNWNINSVADPALLDEYWRQTSQYLWHVIVMLSHY